MTSKYREYKDKGLCGGCGGQPEHGKTYCIRCSKKYSDYSKRKRLKKISIGICPTCKKRPLDSDKKTCSTCLEIRKQQRIDLRNQVLIAYGGPQCKCCGETEIDFLQIDHIDGGGNQQRKLTHKDLYRWLKTHGFPSGFQVLCANCNFAKGAYGICPHQKRKLQSA